MGNTYAERKRTDRAALSEAASREETVRAAASHPGAVLTGHRVDLPEAMRTKMENAFGADFSAVRLYENPLVAKAGAEAVARGSAIAFAPGKLDLSSRRGQALLGHELSHVASQARGEVRGSGFLRDAALEARADREGALAAAGQPVAAGPVTGALSAATPAAAAGPMQARKDGDPDSDYSMEQTANPAPLGLTAAGFERANMQQYGNAIRQDTSYDLQSSMKKRNIVDRTLGKYFYKNDTGVHIAKNIGTGVGMALGGLPLLAAWTGIKKLGGYLRDKNREAVDQFNNYERDYNAMGNGRKFLSFLQSPIAWMTASRRRNETHARNERRRMITTAAQAWSLENLHITRGSDAYFNALRDIPPAEQQSPAGFEKKHADAISYTGDAMAAIQAGSAVTNLAMKAGDKSDLGRALNGGGAFFGALGGTMSAAASFKTANNQAAIGDKDDAAVNRTEGAGALLNVLSNAGQMVSDGAGLLGSSLPDSPILTYGIPGASLLSGVVNAGAGIWKSSQAQDVRNNMSDLGDELTRKRARANGQLSAEEERMGRGLKQVSDMAAGDEAEGVLKTIGGIAQAGSGIAALSGVATPIAVLVGAGGTALNLAGTITGNKMREAAGERQLDDDAQFTKQVELVRRRFVGMNLTDKEAQDLVLQSMGMFSGDKKEAIQNMTMHRAYELTKAANAQPNPANAQANAIHDFAERALKGMKLERVNGRFTLQAVAQKMGFDKNKSWVEQMKETQRQGPRYNPFRH